MRWTMRSKSVLVMRLKRRSSFSVTASAALEVTRMPVKGARSQREGRSLTFTFTPSTVRCRVCARRTSGGTSMPGRENVGEDGTFGFGRRDVFIDLGYPEPYPGFFACCQ